MNFKYKIIAMDFDGTLLTSEKKITDITKNILNEFKLKKYYIVGATARTLNSVKQIIDIDLFDYLILNNGCNIYDVKKKKIIYEKKLLLDTCLNVFNDIEKYADSMDFCSAYSYYLYNSNKKDYYDIIFNIKKIEELANEDIFKINIQLKNQDDLLKVKNIINKKYKKISCFQMQSSKKEDKKLFVLPYGVNKKEALCKVCNEINSNISEVIFFGDNYNDIELLKNVGCGVAMKNSVHEAKLCSQYITDYNNDENGVALFLKEYLK